VNTVAFSPARRRAITGALLVGTFMASLEVMVVGPAMPVVVMDLGGAGLFPWVFTAYILAKIPTMPLYGRMSDRYGRRDAYLLGVGFFIVGSVACALSRSMPELIAARAVQGLGGGSLIVLNMTIFGDMYPVAERTKMQALFSLVWGVSSLLGPLAGGYLTETFSWHAAFWINVPPGLVAAGIIGVLVPRDLGRRQSTKVATELGLLMRDPTQQAIAISGLFLGAGLIGVIGYLPVWVQAVHGGSPIDAGIALIPLSVAWTMTAFVAGRLVDRTGFQTLARLGGILVAVGAAIAAEWPVAQVGLVLLGIGMGFTISIFNVACQEAAPPSLRGTATSIAMLMRTVGSGVGIAVFGAAAGFKPDIRDFAAIPELPNAVAGIFGSIAQCTAMAAIVILIRFPRDTPSTAAVSTPPA
jgi:MFS family permease